MQRRFLFNNESRSYSDVVHIIVVLHVYCKSLDVASYNICANSAACFPEPDANSANTQSNWANHFVSYFFLPIGSTNKKYAFSVKFSDNESFVANK